MPTRGPDAVGIHDESPDNINLQVSGFLEIFFSKVS